MARSKTIPLAALCAFAALAALAAPAGAVQLGPEPAHSPNAEAMTTAYWIAVAVAAVFLVAILGGLLIAVIRFRDARGREPARITAGRGAMRRPVAVLAIGAIAVFVVGVVFSEQARELEPSGPNGLGSAQTAQVGVEGAPPAPAPQQDPQQDEGGPLEINAIAQQWLWRFEYPGHEPSRPLFSYGELVVPVDTAVVLNIGSTDVIHSWWVPELGGQVQATPGKVVQTWFKADEEGRYSGRSTIFSGTAYPVMRSWVRVVSVPEYEGYLERLGDDLAAAQAAVAETDQQEDAQ